MIVKEHAYLSLSICKLQIAVAVHLILEHLSVVAVSVEVINPAEAVQKTVVELAFKEEFYFN